MISYNTNDLWSSTMYTGLSLVIFIDSNISCFNNLFRKKILTFCLDYDNFNIAIVIHYISHNKMKFDLLLKSTMTPIQSRKMTTPMKMTTIRSGRRPSKHPSHLNNNVIPSQYYFTILLNIVFRTSQTKVVWIAHAQWFVHW